MKKNNPLKSLLTILLVLILGYGLFWAVTVGILKIAAACFGWSMPLTRATGIWLILCLLSLVFTKKKEGKK